MSRFNQVLLARIKSFMWRAAGIGAVALVGWMASDVGLLELPTLHFGAVDVNLGQWVTAGLGLVLGEVTKYFNVNRQWVAGE